MKVLHLCYDHINNPWAGGGQSRAWYEINRRLASRHDITVVTGGWKGAANEEMLQGIRVLTAGQPGSYLHSRAAYTWLAARMARTADYDLLVDDMSAFAPHFAAWAPRPKVAYIVLEPIRAAEKKRLLSPLSKLYSRASIRRHSHIVVITDSLKNKIAQYARPDTTIEVNPCGVDERLFELVSEDGDYALFLGRMDVFHKGIDLLIRAACLVTDQVRDFRLVIAGGGGDEQKLRQMVTQSGLDKTVETLGRIPEDQKRELLRQCRFVIMPSRHEGFGIVAVEAAACGKPVVGCRVTGLVDTVRHTVTGLLVEPENVEALASAISRVWQNDDLRLDMARNARPWASQFTWDRAASTQEQFYIRAFQEQTQA